jgi:hypothetical protein
MECPFRLSIVQFQQLEGENDQQEKIIAPGRKHNESEKPVKNENDKTSQFWEGERKLVVPSYMTSVLPEESIQVMEHPAPSGLLRQRTKKIIDILPDSHWKYPKLQIPSEIQQFISSCSPCDRKDFCGLGTDDESVLALTLLGWKPIDKITTDSTPVISLGCSLCFSIMELIIEHNLSSENYKENENGDRHTKRQKRSRSCDPLDTHRHYCPYKCGFPRLPGDPPRPVWRIIFQRLRREKEKNADADIVVAEQVWDQSIDRIRQILRAGLVPKTVDLSS